jgi:SM-20-related protein
MKYFYHGVYRKGQAGLSNLIMSAELGVVLAYLTDRVLVLAENNTPTANVVAYEGILSNSTPSRITDLLDLPVPWIDGESFNIGGRQTLELSHRPSWQSVFYFPPSMSTDTDDFKAFRRDRPDVLTYGAELREVPVLRYTGGPEYDALAFYSYFFYLDEPSKRSVHALLRRLRPKAGLAQLAEKVAGELKPFNAAHIRRGDFKETYGVTILDRTADHVIEALRPHFDPSDRLVILTDESSDPIFEGISRAYPNHVFLDHFILEKYRADFLDLPCHDSVALAYLCQLVAAESQDFIGTMTSTYTALIQRYRGNQGKAEPFKFLWNEIPDEDAEIRRGQHKFGDCIPLEKGTMVEQGEGPYGWNRINPRLNPAWMREWPEAFLRPENGAQLPPLKAESRASDNQGQESVGVSSFTIAFDGQDIALDCDDPGLSANVEKIFGHMFVRASADRVGELSVRTTYGSRHLYVNAKPVHGPLFESNPMKALGREIACQFINARPELIWLHAAAASRGDECVILPGVWGTGKSSLVTELCKLGWTYLSDDIVPVHPKSLRVLPFPQAPQVREVPERELQREELSRLPKKIIALDPDKIAHQSKELRMIVLPRFVASADIELTDPPASMVVGELLENCLNAAQDVDAAIEALCRIVERTEAAQLVYSRPGSAAARLNAMPPGSMRFVEAKSPSCGEGYRACEQLSALPAETIGDVDGADREIFHRGGGNEGMEEFEMSSKHAADGIRDVAVRIDLTGGRVQHTVLPSDSPILHDLFAALAEQSRSEAVRRNILFQVPLDGGRSACTFPSSHLLSVITDPAVLIDPYHDCFDGVDENPDDSAWAAPAYVRIDGFLTPAENEQILKYAVEHSDQFEVATVTPVDPDTRSAQVLYCIDKSKWRNIVVNRLKAHLPYILRSLNLAEFPIEDVELQLTASNDGDYFKVHADDGNGEDDPRHITFVYYAHREKKRFNGGELLLYAGHQPDADGRFGHPAAVIEPVNNTLVAFPSWTEHEVAVVRSPSGEFADSRFTVNGWFRRALDQPE